MPYELLTRARSSTKFRPQSSAIDSLRFAFFSQAGESANRYHITFDRVIAHVWRARAGNRRLLLRSVTFVDDLVHAVACIDDIGRAWADLGERYERALIRRCRGGQDEIKATICVRRLFADLRRRNQEIDGGAESEEFLRFSPSLRCYSGTRPLRNWLADRLNAVQAREASKNLLRTPSYALRMTN